MISHSSRPVTASLGGAFFERFADFDDNENLHDGHTYYIRSKTNRLPHAHYGYVYTILVDKLPESDNQVLISGTCSAFIII